MFKKAISLLLSLMLIVTSLSVTIISVSAADGSVYKVAGSDELTGDGPDWQPSAELSPSNVMTAKEDGTYEKVYTDVQVGNSYAIKVVENTADGNFNWYGIDGGEDNFIFNVTSVCDVTVTFDPTTLSITVTGDGVVIPEGFDVESIRTVGNGDGNWLNGVAWDPKADENLMTEVEPNVYEITYTDLDEFYNYQVKFAANGSWQPANWGGTYEGSGVESEAVFSNNPANIVVEVPYELADVTLRLDLTNFDYASKSGAKFTVTVTDKTGGEETTAATEATEETTEATEETTVPTEPETTEATTAATEAPKGLTVNATSNYFPAFSTFVKDGEEYVTVTYFLDSAKDMLDCQWELKYDPNVLQYDFAVNMNEAGKDLNLMPQVNNLIWNVITEDPEDFNSPQVGRIKANCTDLKLYDFANKGYTPFVTATFKVVGSGETTVDLYVEFLRVSKIGANFKDDPAQEEILVDFGEIKDTVTKPNRLTVPHVGLYDPAATNPVETEPVTEATTVATEPETTVPATEPETTVPATEPVGDAVYVVAGVSELCGATWDGTPASGNVMTDNGDGTFSIVFSDVAPKNDLQLKVVENIGEAQKWIGIGPKYDDNFTFNVVEECDVTVTYEPATKTITVTGTGVVIPTELVIESMRTVGNGDGNWLNGVAWDPADDANLMTEVADKVYEITYKDLETFENYQVKFAANGGWANSWGYGKNDQSPVYPGSGVEFDAVYNGGNIVVEVPYELADVTLRLDLTNFDFVTKTGAKITITVTEKTPATEPETTVPATEPETTVPATEPETTVPATEPETTVPATEPETTAPATGLNIKATSNYFPGTNRTLTEADGTDLVTVTYYFDCAKQLLNTQWTLTFDPAVLSALPENNVAGFMPFATKGAMYETPAEGVIKGSASDLGLYDIKDGQAFVQVTFKALTFDGDTVVDLYVEDLTVAERNAEGKLDEEKQETLVVNGVKEPTDTPLGLDTFITPGPATPVEPETTAPVEPETTVPATEPVGDAVYVVAGVPDLCGNEWDPSPVTSSDNVMTDNGDGTFSKVYNNVAPKNDLQLKVVENIGEAQSWIGIGPKYEDNFTFNVVEECDVTVTYEPATKTITVTGTGVVIPTELVIESMRTVGNGDGNWLNGVAWDPADDANLMTEVADKVYEITYKDLETFENYQVKFAANGGWANSWGYGKNDQSPVYPGSGVEFDAVYNGGNIVVEVPYELADVTLRLDLTNFDFVTKQGAKITITVTDKTPATEPETTVPTEPETTVPTEPETTVPTEPETTAPATEAPTDAPSTDATGATGATVNPGTADTPTGGTTSNGSAVQTGNASMAVIILLVLVSACGVLYFTRKRVK